MNANTLKYLGIASSLVIATSCATTDPSNKTDSDFKNAISQQQTCNYHKDLAGLEAVKDVISATEVSSSAILDQEIEISRLIAKTENITTSARPEDVLGCRFLEMEARVLRVGMPKLDSGADFYLEAKNSIDDVKELCTSINDERMCSVAHLHDATLFSRHIAKELKRIAGEDNAIPIDWDTTRSLTQSINNHIVAQWPSYFGSNTATGDQTSLAIERSLFASACEMDKATTLINRRIGLNINKDTNGNLVPYGKDSGELLAHIAVVMDLSPNDSCNENPTDRNCRGKLASKLHLACLSAGEVAHN